MSATVNVNQVTAILGLPRTVRTPADLDQAVRKGLPYASVARVARRFREADRAGIYQIVASRSTLSRRETEGRLKLEEGERLERIARLTALAEQVWEDQEDAQAFLTSAHPMLNGATPLALAATDIGARRVEELLWRLEYSLPV